MDETLYHVVLEGRKVGPYDRRTLVGMRVKNALTANHVLIGVDGTQLTVGELVGERVARAEDDFRPSRHGGMSTVQAVYPARFVGADAAAPVPDFKGEIEARIQTGVLRLAGRFRQGLRTKEGRVKIPIADILQTRVRASLAELWLRGEEAAGPQRVTLDLGTPEAAEELLRWFPDATARVEPDGVDAPKSAKPRGPRMNNVVVAAVAAIVVVFMAVVVALTNRH